jgi:hypothetical protein
MEAAMSRRFGKTTGGLLCWKTKTFTILVVLNAGFPSVDCRQKTSAAGGK